DLAALNAVLRRWFDRFEIHRTDDGDLRIVPALADIAAARLMAQAIERMEAGEPQRGPIQLAAGNTPDCVGEDEAAIAIEVRGPEPLTDNDPRLSGDSDRTLIPHSPGSRRAAPAPASAPSAPTRSLCRR